MVENQSASRWLAILLLAQLAIAPVAMFALLDDIFAGPGGFLANAAPHATSLAAAVLLSLGLAVLSAGIAVVLWPVLRPRSERMALSLAMLGTAGLALSAFEMVGLLSMLSLSQAYAAAGAEADALYQALRGVVGGQRNWTHLIHLLAGGGMLLVLHASLFRFRLVPRWIAGFGMLAATSQMIAVAKPLFGGWVIFPMIAPLGIANLLLLGWLFWKPGFGRSIGKTVIS